MPPTSTISVDLPETTKPIQPKLLCRTHAASPEDEICVTGISGKFPNSENIDVFDYNLYNQIDMIDDSEKRWRHFNYEIPRRMGKIDGLDKFDATFFGVHFKQAHTMDPQCRLLIETAYEAVLDSGTNPRSLNGQKIGCFMAACFSESEKTWFYEKISSGGFGITGCSRAMLANRISYCLGIHGPSFLVDTACSSSMTALDCAFTAIRNGECEGAIVGGANLLIHPYVTLQFVRLGALSASGYCRPFTKDALGYVRSEAINVIFLQKAKYAKRVYGSLLYSKINCDGYKSEGITFPSIDMQHKLFSEFYREVDVDPGKIAYVEAHGTGTNVGDPVECDAIDRTFSVKSRKSPLIVGSVKSNMGHSESASGVVSITKMCLAFERGYIAPNIHFTELRAEIPSLMENRLKVCLEPIELDNNAMVGVSSFGFGGGNAHCLLRRNPKPKKNNGAPDDKLPRLITWSGRTEDGMEVFFNAMERRPLDIEHVALIHNIQSEEIPGYIFRGYGLYTHNPEGNAVCVTKETQHYTGLKRPIVWVFSGMGSQWPGMGTSLMQIPIFHDSIQKSHKLLEPFGLNLIDIITSEDPTTFDNIVHSFVGIASIQVAIVDMLHTMGLDADLYIGHSVGELGCAYADGCFTAEQMVLAAYSRGMASIETNVIRGSMAAVGLGYKKLRSMVPANIDIACHNSLDSSTISGPEEDIDRYVAELKEQGIFAKAVPCSNIAYHSRYIADMGPKLLEKLQKVVPTPVKRSPKWLSTSHPKNRWEFDESKYSSAEYHVNNLLSSVLFEETSVILPTNALTIEIAPHGLLQAIIKKSMPKAVHFGLTQRGNKDNVSYFFTALGKLFVSGLKMPVERIYPAIDFPVSRGTPKISPLIRWDHTEDWFVTTFEFKGNSKSGERIVEVALNDKDYDFIAGHTIDGRVLFPATGYLYLVWETLATIKGKFFFDTNVHFEDIRFLRATTMTLDEMSTFKIMIQSGTGRFEITDNNIAVVTGYAAEIEDAVDLTTLPFLPKSNYPMLDEKDFYKELRLRGYQYSGAFKSVYQARADGLYGKVKWDNNWMSFLDCLLQISIIGKDSRSLILPTRIQKILINSKEHMRETMRLDPELKFFEVQQCTDLGILRCGGIEIIEMTATSVARRKQAGYPVLESYKFIPNLPTPQLSKLDALRVCIQTALENFPVMKIKAIEVDVDKNEPIIQYLQESISDLPLITYDLMLLTPQELNLVKVHVEDGKLSTQSNCAIIIATMCLSRREFVEQAVSSMTDNGYLLSREPLDLDIKNIQIPAGFQLILIVPVETEYLLLFQRIGTQSSVSNQNVIYISSKDTEYEWLDTLRSSMANGQVIAVAEKEVYSGIIGLINCVRKEPMGNRVRCVFIDDANAPAFDLNNTFYKNQLNLGMAFNIYRNGQWGTYRHLHLAQTIEEKPRREHCYANVLQRGDLTSLCWLEGSINSTRRNDIINIQYASLNFRDIMLASGKLGVEVIGPNRLDYECVLGMEFSGVNKKGERIMGTTVSGAMANQVVQFDHLTWVVPDTWTLREAATCPIVYLTVYSAFFLYKPISKGNSVLIHAGSGGVGLAAIRVALAYGLEVYTTVSTAQKKKFLMETFPQLKECNIGCSRDCSFETMIKLHTKGAGVNYVLNSLAEDKLHASIRCLGLGGVFLEIGKFDLANDTKIGLGSFLNEITFRTVMVDNLFKASAEERIMIATMVSKDLHAGIIQPLHSTVFQVDELEKAYRYLGAGKHVGKVVIKLRENPYDEWTVPIKVVPRPYFDPDLVYVMPGGLGGFGLELADWMVIRGCRKLVLSSRNGITKSYQAFRVKIWETYGTEVIINTSDITTLEGCEDLLKAALQHGQIGGIFNLAMVLKDSLLENQTVLKFKECMAPKAMATKYFDELSRKLCPHLKYFVIFSSFICGRGNAGQSNYAMANSVMERIIEQRLAEGLPGKGIQWGAVGDVGLVADMAEDKLDIEIGGTLQQSIASCLQTLDVLLTVPDPIVASMVVAEKREGSGDDIKLIDCILNIIGIRDAKSISMTATLSDVGMDSLIAVEIKSTLEREFEIFLTAQELRLLTFARLQELQDERETHGMENVKLKLANADKTVGLNILHKNLWTDDMSTTPLIRLHTRNNLDKFSQCVIFVPGIEGVAGLLWNQLGASINMPAYVLQLTNVYDKKNISEMVEALSEFVKKTFEKLEFFYLIGYSFGSIVTLELVKQLEESGVTGHVMFIDGSPAFVKKLAEITVENTHEPIRQHAIFKIIINYVYPKENPKEIMETLVKCKTDEECLTNLIGFGKSKNKYPVRYLEIMIPTLYNRLNIMLNLDTDNNITKIKSPVLLIRPTEVGVTEIADDYELSRYTDGVVNVKYIDGNHTTMLENIALPELINDYDPNVESDRQFKAYIDSNKTF